MIGLTTDVLLSREVSLYLAPSDKFSSTPFNFGNLKLSILYLLVKSTSSVFNGLTPNPFVPSQFDKSLSAASMTSLIVGRNFPLVRITTSSAYATIFLPLDSKILRTELTASNQSRGESTPPCGIPLLNLFLILSSPKVELITLLPNIETTQLTRKS
ncbi:hypothetical protein FF38_09399 [Lucilia cuprina]|uniref:Uncharacterized protein n=1 Tax=Lucilia cuprina TaxID=7375 RepID=A0A0L0CQR5_LUCCU|nr:hypothetical protein FF38_09399 [Lucilia cuprina]